MNIVHDIKPERITPEEFISVIEIPMGSKNKYEIDKETGMLILDRVLYTSTHYPFNYGFIPLTHFEDGDPLDVFVICSQQIDPLCLVKCRPIGCICMIDGGKKDYKIISVALGDPQYNYLTDIHELPSHVLDELQHFLRVYKELEKNKTTVVNKIEGSTYARRVVKEAIEEYIKIKAEKEAENQKTQENNKK